MSEQDLDWKASVDGVVSEFDEVTRHLRIRQRQALRVVWSTVGALTLATGALIGLNLSSFPLSAGPGGQQPSLALLSPSAPEPAPVPGGGSPYFPGIAPTPAPVEILPPPPDVTAASTGIGSAPRRARAVTPAAPPALVASTAPVTAEAPPPATHPPADPPAPSGLVDSLVSGVVHLLG